MALSDEDREALNVRVDDLLDAWARGQGWPDDAIDAVVEQIVARHVTAALEAAAEGVDRLAADFPDGSLASRLVSPSVQIALHHAAEGIRAATTPP